MIVDGQHVVRDYHAEELKVKKRTKILQHDYHLLDQEFKEMMDDSVESRNMNPLIRANSLRKDCD